MTNPEFPFSQEPAGDSPETVSVEDVLSLLRDAAVDIEIQAELAKHDITTQPRPAEEDHIGQIEYDNDMLQALVEAKARDSTATFIETLVSRVRELKRQ